MQCILVANQLTEDQELSNQKFCSKFLTIKARHSVFYNLSNTETMTSIPLALKKKENQILEIQNPENTPIILFCKHAISTAWDRVMDIPFFRHLMARAQITISWKQYFPLFQSFLVLLLNDNFNSSDHVPSITVMHHN